MLMSPRYIHCDRNHLSMKAAIHTLQQCIADVCVWMHNSALILNEAKVEFIVFKPFLTDNMLQMLQRHFIKFILVNFSKH